MRMNIYYSLLLMILLSVASIGCSDNNVEWESDEVPSDKITLDIQGTLDLLHNESAVVKIITGNGSYQVDSQDKDIAEAYNRQIKKFPTEKQNVSLKHILT